MATDLKQLSARLGLSPTTVSRALNGYTDVSETTRVRVVQMAKEMGYQPNLLARRLATGRADAVGIVYALGPDHLGNPAFLDMLTGLSQRLEASNVDLLLAAALESAELRTYERLVRGRRVDGLIVAHTRLEDPRIAYLLESGLPFVAYGRTAHSQDHAWFDFDNVAGGAMAVREIAALGHRRIGYVHAPLDFSFAAQRREGFLRGLAAAGLEPQPQAMVEGSLERRRGYVAGQALLALAERPTAIVVDNNVGGVGVLRAMLDAGVEIGREISIVVYDGVPADTLLQGVQVAAIAQPTSFESGRMLGDMVMALVDGKPVQHQVLRQPVFVPGSSLQPPR